MKHMIPFFRKVMRRNAESKNRFYSLLQTIIGICSYFFVIRYVINSLGLEILGLWSLTVGFVSFIRLIDLSGSSSLSRLVAIRKKGSFEQTKTIDTVSIIGLLLFSLLGILFYFSLSDIIFNNLRTEYISLGKNLLLIAVISLPINMLSMAQLSALDGLGRSDIRSIINIICYLIFIFLGIFLISRYGLIGLAYAQLTQYILSLMLARIKLYKYIESLRLLPIYWSSNIFKNIIGYVLRIQFLSMPMMTLDPLIRIIISRLYGLEFVGIYELAYKINGHMRTLIQGYFNPILPELAAVTLRGKNLAYEMTINYHKKFLYINFLLYSSLVLFSPVLSIFLLGEINEEFIKTQSFICIGWCIPTFFLPTNYLAKAQDVLHYSIVGQFIVLLITIICIYISAPLNAFLTVPLSISFGLIVGNLFGFLGETINIRKSLTKYYDFQYILSIIKISILKIAFICVYLTWLF